MRIQGPLKKGEQLVGRGYVNLVVPIRTHTLYFFTKPVQKCGFIGMHKY